MNEQEKRENVIKCLRCLSDTSEAIWPTKERCEKCPWSDWFYNDQGFETWLCKCQDCFRDALTILEAQKPLTVAECKDLQVLRDIKSGKVLKSGCKDYVIYNGDWYRKNAWDHPEKAQEPRLLTADEMKSWDKDVWVEDFDDDNVIVLDKTVSGFAIACMRGKKRCWTARPTDEQRKAVEWE